MATDLDLLTQWRADPDSVGPTGTQVLIRDLADEIDRQAAEIRAFRQAVRDGTGPWCADVCLRSCVGVCDIAREDD